MHSHATGLFRVAMPCCLLSAMAFETRGSTWCGAAVTSLSLTQHGYTTTMLVHTRKATADSSLLFGTHISQAWSALHWAAMRGDAVLTRTLLTAGCNVYQMSRVCLTHRRHNTAHSAPSSLTSPFLPSHAPLTEKAHCHASGTPSQALWHRLRHSAARHWVPLAEDNAGARVWLHR